MRSREPAVWFPAVRANTGADVFTQRLANGLAKRGIRTAITWLPLRAEYAPWTVSVLRPPEWATIVHVNTWLPSRFIPKDLPVVATIHHAMHHPAVRLYKGPVRATYHRCWIAPNERRVLRRADRIVAVSRFVAEIARQTLLDAPMQVIYNGVDTDKFRPGGRQRKPQEPFRLLYVGSWKKLKGVDLLAPIMQELGNGFELRYTGGSSVERDKAHMPANMHDVGRLHGEDAVVAAMQDVDALLFPSRSEGLPLSAIEAMATGLPIIAARGSSLVEVVEDGTTGLLCNSDDIAAFAMAARHAASDTGTYEQLRSQARTLACSKFSVDAMIENYMKCYIACITNVRP